MIGEDDELKRLNDECIFAEAWPDEHIKTDRCIEEDIRAAWLLGSLKIEFDEGDILAPLRAMHLSYKWGFTLPAWANKYISEAFYRYLEEGRKKGSAKLDVFFNLSDKRPFSRDKTRGQYESICEEIVRLNRIFRFSKPIAYRLVRKSIAKHLSIDQIDDIYSVYGKHTRSFPSHVWAIKFNSLEDLKEYLFADNEEFRNELFEANLLSKYMKCLDNIYKSFTPGKYYGDIADTYLGG